MAKEKSHGARNVAIGAAVAGVAGYVAGILTAPKSGKETRKDIKEKAAQAKTEAEKRLKTMHSELSVLIAKGKKQVTTTKESAREGLLDALDKAQAAKDKARDMLSALHEGGADDKDLQKAVADVDDAIEHLRAYLNKHA
jgi:gas vesicle protein